MKCTDVQAHLFAYITDDTGQNRASLIKKHLGKCEECQAEAAKIQEAFHFLQGTHTTESIPTHLSEKRRALIMRSFMHPVLDFIYRHHIIISLATAIIATIVTLSVLRQVRIWRTEKIEAGISVSLGNKKPPSK